MRKELSGLFLPPDRFAQAVAELSQPSCTITEVRLYHNEPYHTVELLSGLASGNTAIQTLDIYTLAGPACDALHSFLACGASTCRPTTLTVHGCQGCKAATAIGQGLASASCRVTQLNLSGLQDLELAALLQQLPQPIGSSTCTRALHHLSLVRCMLGAATANNLLTLSRLTHLSLHECVVSDAHLHQLIQQAFIQPHQPAATTEPASTLQSLALGETHQPSSDSDLHTSIQVLELCGTQAGTQAAQAFSKLLAQPWCALTRLCISNSTRFGDAGVVQLADGLAANHSLHTLELSHCGVGPTGAQAIAATLTTHPCLECLVLDHNSIGATGLMAILLAVSSPPVDSGEASRQGGSRLQKLQLDSNWVRGNDLPAWPAGWQVHAPLQVLQLARNHLSDAGAALLQTALDKAGCLTQLDLCTNGVGAVGAASLAKMLAQHTGLQELKIDSNRLHDAGATLLLDAATDHPALRVLRAEDCRVVDQALRTRVSEVTQALAARHYQQQQQQQQAGSGGSHPAPPRVRVGRRFAPEDYTLRAAAASQSPPGIAAAVAAAPAVPLARTGIRMGTRFPPHVYAVQIVEEAEEEGQEQAGTGVMQGPGARGKHVLGAGERDEDPRASKVHESDTPGGGGGGAGGGGGGADGGQQCTGPSPFRDWHPSTPESQSSAGQQGHDPFNGSTRYTDRYSAELHACSSGNMSFDTCSPLSSDVCPSPPAHARRSAAGGFSKSLDLGNRVVTGPQGIPTAISCGVQQQQQQQVGSYGQTTYLVARPSFKKRALTPQQQALFDIF